MLVHGLLMWISSSNVSGSGADDSRQRTSPRATGRCPSSGPQSPACVPKHHIRLKRNAARCAMALQYTSRAVTSAVSKNASRQQYSLLEPCGVFILGRQFRAARCCRKARRTGLKTPPLRSEGCCWASLQLVKAHEVRAQVLLTSCSTAGLVVIIPATAGGDASAAS